MKNELTEDLNSLRIHFLSSVATITEKYFIDQKGFDISLIDSGSDILFAVNISQLKELPTHNT